MAKVIEKIGLCQLGTMAHPSVASDAALCDVMLTMLRDQFYRDGIPRYIEGLDSSESGSAIANKTGAVDAVRSDVGLIASKNGLIVISAFTYDNADHSYSSDDEGDVTIAKLSRAIVEAWSPAGLDDKVFVEARRPGYAKTHSLTDEQIPGLTWHHATQAQSFDCAYRGKPREARPRMTLPGRRRIAGLGAGAGHLLHCLLHLFGRDVADVGGDEPLVAEGIFDSSVAVAVELVGQRTLDGGSCIDRLFED